MNVTFFYRSFTQEDQERLIDYVKFNKKMLRRFFPDKTLEHLVLNKSMINLVHKDREQRSV